MDSTVLLEEPETLDAELVQEEAEAMLKVCPGARELEREQSQAAVRARIQAKAEAERRRPGPTMLTDGSRLDDGAAVYSAVWQNGQSWVVIKTHKGYTQEGLRYGGRRSLQGGTDDPGKGHGFHGRPGRRRANGFGGAWPRPDARAPGKKTHRGAKEGRSRHHRRNPVVSGTQGSPRKREG